MKKAIESAADERKMTEGREAPSVGSIFSDEEGE